MNAMTDSGFNSTLVRLKPEEKENPGEDFLVSIPLWFD